MALGAKLTLAAKYPLSTIPVSPSCSYSLFYFNVHLYWTLIPWLSRLDLESTSGILDVNCVVSHARNSAFPRENLAFERSSYSISGPKEPKSRTHSHSTVGTTRGGQIPLQAHPPALSSIFIETGVLQPDVCGLNITMGQRVEESLADHARQAPSTIACQ